MAEQAPAPLDGRRIVVFATEQVGDRMAGPAIRALNLARQLHARGAQVTLATPTQVVLSDRALVDGLQLATFGTPSWRAFRGLANEHDVVVTQPQRVDVAWGLHRSDARVIYDLYVPSFVERIAQLATEPGDEDFKRRLLERDRLEYATAIELGDGFICASEEQRSHWLGALGQAGRFQLDLTTRDPRGDQLLGVVPFGVPDEPPPTGGAGAIRGTLVPDDAVVLLWTGGIWNWFDPVLIVEALARARETDPRIHLVVMGMHHPEAAWQEQEASRALRSRAAELGLLESGAVVLCEEWIPYAERHRYLLDADAAVSAHHDSLETRFSFRTRFLDQLWAGLPTITTAGGELTDRMTAAGAALTVAAGDVSGWVSAMHRIAQEPELRTSTSAAARALADDFRWSQTTQPLVSVVGGTDAPPARPHLGTLLRYVALLVRIRVQAKGVRSLTQALVGASGRRT